MHVTRPKSAKGRSRPALHCTQSVHTVSQHGSPLTPRPPSNTRGRAGSSLSSATQARRGSLVKTEEIPELLQVLPAQPMSSLNRYRVLPSIEKKEEESGDTATQSLVDKTTRLSMSDDLIIKAKNSHVEQQRLSSAHRRAASRSTPEMTAPAEARGSRGQKRQPVGGHSETGGSPLDREQNLLLAVRSPSGERFQHLFRPSDTLQTVIATAEAEHGTSYEGGIIETMEVPRRSFHNLSLTLEQSGICNRTVLCVSQKTDHSAGSA
ncbi:UBX domain-containing protein 10 [Lepisosteus oculatus]|uniref:UBX domain-containing protein 10 n=1 Tax=Lepisosteus oculatus TaxID=7918 RepID=UPI0037153050